MWESCTWSLTGHDLTNLGHNTQTLHPFHQTWLNAVDQELAEACITVAAPLQYFFCIPAWPAACYCLLNKPTSSSYTPSAMLSLSLCLLLTLLVGLDKVWHCSLHACRKQLQTVVRNNSKQYETTPNSCTKQFETIRNNTKQLQTVVWNNPSRQNPKFCYTMQVTC